VEEDGLEVLVSLQKARLVPGWGAFVLFRELSVRVDRLLEDVLDFLRLLRRPDADIYPRGRKGG
jgi:hypothetical protein